MSVSLSRARKWVGAPRVNVRVRTEGMLPVNTAGSPGGGLRWLTVWLSFVCVWSVVGLGFVCLLRVSCVCLGFCLVASVPYVCDS